MPACGIHRFDNLYFYSIRCHFFVSPYYSTTEDYTEKYSFSHQHIVPILLPLLYSTTTAPQMIEVNPEYAGQEKKQQKSNTLCITKVCIIEKCTVLAAFSQFFLPLSLFLRIAMSLKKTLGKKKSIDPFI